MFQVCTLNGIAYAYNPPTNSKNPPIRSVTRAATWNGQVVTDWGLITQDRTIEQAWPVLDISVFDQFQTLYLAGGSYPFVDEWGTAYTVTIGGLTFEGIVTGGQAYLGVKMLLWPS